MASIDLQNGSASPVEALERAPLSHDVDVDVCVVGAGLAGLTAAYEIARRGWSVVVVEANRIAWSASGSNIGIVAPGFSEPVGSIIDRVGMARARDLWRLSIDGMEHVRATAREIAMPIVEKASGKLLVQRINDEDGLKRQVAMLHLNFGTDIEAWPTGQVREVLRSPLYFQAAHMRTAFQIDPLRYAMGLAAVAERAGARIFEQTPAIAIDPAGVRKRIDTPNGRVRAGHVVLAGGAHIKAVFPAASETIMRFTSHAALTAPLGERLADAIRYFGAVADTRRGGDQYRVVDGDRLLWSSRLTRSPISQRRLAGLMRRDIRCVYPQLGKVEIERAWSGSLAFAVHKMPQIGEPSPGVWLAGAFGDHGLNTTAMAGDLIARAIVEDDDRWRLFSDYELVWSGGRLGQEVVRSIRAIKRMRNAVAEHLSRYRETRDARAAELATRLAAIERQQKEADAAATMSQPDIGDVVPSVDLNEAVSKQVGSYSGVASFDVEAPLAAKKRRGRGKDKTPSAKLPQG
ncbi:MAG TPA: FAD-binding oxidoreductase [Xanthobacteraceae bacterium]|nr:FAD-binding oxidoreductase [Xanthobacteraceae bacterium]